MLQSFLQEILELSWQVRHDIVAAEYYRDGCTNPQKLLEVLSQVKVRLYVLGVVGTLSTSSTNGMTLKF